MHLLLSHYIYSIQLNYQHAKSAEGMYLDYIIGKILAMGRKDKYSLITDFAWYLDVLTQLTLMHSTQHGHEVMEQLIDISIRVTSIRPYALEVMLSVLLNYHLMDGGVNTIVIHEVLKAAAWIVGEYSEILAKIILDTSPDDLTDDDDDTSDSDDNNNDDDESKYLITGPNGVKQRSNWRGQPLYNLIIDALLHPRVYHLSPSIQSIYLQSIMKVFIRACQDSDDNSVISQIITSIRMKLPVFLQVHTLTVN